MQETGMIDQHNIDLAVLKSFTLEVRRHYRDNPFHNWYHGFSVFHFAYLVLKVCSNVFGVSVDLSLVHMPNLLLVHLFCALLVCWHVCMRGGYMILYLYVAPPWLDTSF